MSHNYTQTELLTRYLDGELEPAEIAAAKELLNSNEAARQELSRIKATQQAVKLTGLKYQIQQAVAKEKAAAPVVTMQSRKSYLKWVSIAAMILLVSGVGYQYASINENSIFQDANLEYKTVVTRGEAQDKLMTLFSNRDYKGYLSAYQAIENKTTENQLMAGISLLNLGNTSASIESLEPLTKGSSVEKDAAEYYLALSYLKNKEFEKSLQLLEAINANPEHGYHNKVSNWLIQKIKIARSKS